MFSSHRSYLGAGSDKVGNHGWGSFSVSQLEGERVKGVGG